MNKNLILSASRLAVLALACVVTIGLAACSSDDDDKDSRASNPILGTWVHESKNYTETYYFNASGTGLYSNSAGTRGDFTYKIPESSNKSAGVVYIKITLWRDGQVWRSEYDYLYKIEDDVLRLGDKTYKRKQ